MVGNQFSKKYWVAVITSVLVLGGLPYLGTNTAQVDDTAQENILLQGTDSLHTNWQNPSIPVSDISPLSEVLGEATFPGGSDAMAPIDLTDPTYPLESSNEYASPMDSELSVDSTLPWSIQPASQVGEVADPDELVRLVVLLPGEPLARTHGIGLLDDLDIIAPLEVSPTTHAATLDKTQRSLELATQQSEAMSSLKSSGVELEHRWSYSYALNGFSIVVPRGQIDMVRSDPLILSARETTTFTMDLNQTVPLVNGTTARVDYGTNGSGVVIAILDTGIDVSHPGLDDLDDDPGTIDPKVIGFQDFTEDNFDLTLDDPYDDNGHGTHVAGIAAGTGGGNTNYTGVAPGAQLVGVKVLYYTGGGLSDDIIAGLDWCISNITGLGIDIVSMSLGRPENSDGTTDMERAVDNAVYAGLLVVVSAGNLGPSEFTVGNPGTSNLALTVANNDLDREMAESSSRGPTHDFKLKPDISAPGVDVVSANAYYDADEDGVPELRLDMKCGYPNYVCGDGFVGERYYRVGGTSMSTPHVSGAAALMLENNPGLKPLQVKSILMTSSHDLGFSKLAQGAGMLDVPSGLNADIAPMPSSISAQVIGQYAGIFNRMFTINLYNVVGHDVYYSATVKNQTHFGGYMSKSSFFVDTQDPRQLRLYLQVDTDAIGWGWHDSEIILQSNDPVPKVVRIVFGFFVGNVLDVDFYPKSNVPMKFIIHNGTLQREYTNPGQLIRLFLPTGRYDFITLYRDQFFSHWEMVVKENELVQGMRVLTVSDLEATHRVSLEAKNEWGNLIPQSRYGKSSFSLIYKDSFPVLSRDIKIGFEPLYISSFSTDYRLDMHQRAYSDVANTYYDIDGSAVGLSIGTTLSTDYSNYKHLQIDTGFSDDYSQSLYMKLRDVVVDEVTDPGGNLSLRMDKARLLQSDNIELQYPYIVNVYMLSIPVNGVYMDKDGYQHRNWQFLQYDFSTQPFLQYIMNEPLDLGRSPLLILDGYHIRGYSYEVGFPQIFDVQNTYDMGLEFFAWMGRMNNEPNAVNIHPEAYFDKLLANNVLFRDQTQSNDYTDPYPTTFQIQSGGIYVLEGNVNDYEELVRTDEVGKHWYFVSRYNFPLPSSGKYTMVLKKDYASGVVSNPTATAALSFDTSLSDPNPPAIKHVNVLHNGVLGDGLGQTGNTLEFSLDPVGGSISAVEVFVYHNSSWTSLPLIIDGDDYTVDFDLPSGASSDQVALQISVMDDSLNILRFTFGIPAVAGELFISNLVVEAEAASVGFVPPAYNVDRDQPLTLSAMLTNTQTQDETGVGLEFEMDGHIVAIEGGLTIPALSTVSIPMYWDPPLQGTHTLKVNIINPEPQSKDKMFFVNHRPVVMAPDVVQATQDVPFQLNVGVDDEGEVLFQDDTDLFDLSGTTGAVQFTPVNSQVGDYIVRFSVVDSLGAVGYKDVSFSVVNVNDPPVFVGAPLLAAVEEALYQYQAEVVDIDQEVTLDPLTYSIIQGPAGMNIVGTSGMISWTPSNTQAANSHQIKLEVSDGDAIDYLNFSILVANVNDPVSITSSPNTVSLEDSVYLYSVLAMDDDLLNPSQESLAYRFDTAPAGMIIGASDGVIYWTPVNSQSGKNHAVSINVTDGETYATQTYQLWVESQNDSPQFGIIPGTFSLWEDTLNPRLIDLFEYVSDDDNDDFQLLFSVADNTQREHVKLVITDQRYLGVSWLEANWTGSTLATLQVWDPAGQTNFSTPFLIGITPVNDPPYFMAIPQLAIQEDLTSDVRDVDLKSYVVDADVDAAFLEYSYDFDGDKIQVSLSPDGVLNIRPKENDFAGTLVIDVMASDGVYLAEQSITVTVTPVNDPPVFLPITGDYSLAEDTFYDKLVDLYDFLLDPDTPLPYIELSVVESSPPFVNVSIYQNRYLSVNAYQGEQNDHWWGEVNVVVQAKDPSGAKATIGPFSLQITSVNDPPMWFEIPIVLLNSESMSISINLSEFSLDPDGDDLVFQLLNQTSDGLTSSTLSDNFLDIDVFDSNSGVVGLSKLTLTAFDGQYETRKVITIVVSLSSSGDPGTEPDPGDGGSADNNQVPTVQILSPLNNQEVKAEDNVLFIALFSDPEGGPGFYSWDFGDNTTSRQKSPVHAYATPGTYSVELWVEDDGGLKAFTSIEVLVYADTDNDGIPDRLDSDKDGDGFLDIDDVFPLDSLEWADMDGDGQGDNYDDDDDGDGVPDQDDPFPLDPGLGKNPDPSLALGNSDLNLAGMIGMLLVALLGAILMVRDFVKPPPPCEPEQGYNQQSGPMRMADRGASGGIARGAAGGIDGTAAEGIDGAASHVEVLEAQLTR